VRDVVYYAVDLVKSIVAGGGKRRRFCFRWKRWQNQRRFSTAAKSRWVSVAEQPEADRPEVVRPAVTLSGDVSGRKIAVGRAFTDVSIYSTNFILG